MLEKVWDNSVKYMIITCFRTLKDSAVSRTIIIIIIIAWMDHHYYYYFIPHLFLPTTAVPIYGFPLLMLLITLSRLDGSSALVQSSHLPTNLTHCCNCCYSQSKIQ